MTNEVNRTGAYLGSALGVSSWAFVLVVLGLAAGDFELVLEVGLPCVMLSIGEASLLILVFELAQRAIPDDRKLHVRMLWGGILFAMGMFFLLANHWIGPRLESSVGVAEMLDSVGSAYRIPIVFVWVCLVASAVLLTMGAVRVVRLPRN